MSLYSVHNIPELHWPTTLITQGGRPASAAVLSGGSNTETVGVEIFSRETTVLKNCPKFFCEIVLCKPLSGLDEVEQRVA